MLFTVASPDNRTRHFFLGIQNNIHRLNVINHKYTFAMKVFKFGGASVNSCQAIRNMATIVERYSGHQLLIVVSAMGKTTNLLERVVPGVPHSKEERLNLLKQNEDFHINIMQQLFANDDNTTFKQIQTLFAQLNATTSSSPTNYNCDYDQTVCFGELLSTTIISGYLNSIGLRNKLLDVRHLIRTDTYHREGNVDFALSEQLIRAATESAFHDCNIIVTQGFIAGASDGSTTTLGREGSDYSASILSYCLHADDMTIWKDVPGFLNADPKHFKNTVKINQIPYNEAIELAYYGASVIHPKTVKPIQNRSIPLHIKSFIDPSAPGSDIGPYAQIEPLTPLYIIKENQTLISIHPKDFSFIAEENLHTIFAALASLNVKVNMMQNSALSFSLCTDHNDILLSQLRENLSEKYLIHYNTGLQLVTIRYYNQQTIDDIVGGRNVILQQRSRNTTQLLVEA